MGSRDGGAPNGASAATATGSPSGHDGPHDVRNASSATTAEYVRRLTLP